MSLKLTFSPLILFVLTITPVFFPYTSFSSQSYLNMPVEEVRFEGPFKAVEDELKAIIYVKEGKKYSAADVRKSIKHLYMKGLFSNVYIDASEGDRGLVLTFHLDPQRWLSSIDIKGNKMIPDDDILPFLPLREGAEFSDELLPLIEEKIYGMYKKEGYYSVNVSVEVEEKDNAVNMLLKVKEGKASVLSNISFSGNKALSDRELRKVMKTRPRKPISVTSLERDRKNILNLYFRSGYLEAEVSDPIINFDEGEKSAAASYVIEAGPKSEIIFSENSYFKDKDLLKVLKQPSGAIVSSETVRRWEKSIVESYQQSGYPFVNVTGKLEIKEESKRVTLLVDEELRYRIGRITIEGNRKIKNSELMEETALQKGFFSKPFSEELLNMGLEKIRHLYVKNGFLKAEIKREITFIKKKKRVNVGIIVSEGIQTFVENVSFKGAFLFEDDGLMKIGGVSESEPFNLPDIEKASLRIIEAYSKHGYIYASVAREDSFSSDGRNASVEFHINEGLKVLMGKVIIRGNRFTKSHVIMRELALREGDIYSPEKILEDRQRVYGLGLFRGVKYRQINEGKKETVKEMLLDVHERKAGAIEVGIGYATDIGVRGFFETSYINLGGTTRSIRIRSEASGIEKKVLLGYREPWLLGKRMDGRVNLLYQSNEKDSYDLEKGGIILGIDHELSDFSSLSLQYTLERNRYFNVLAGANQTEGKSTTASIGPVLIRDSRDDPFNTRKGSVNLIRYELAKSALASDDEFQKITVHSSWYYPIIGKSTGALSIRLGHIGLLGTTTSVPIERRFFLGGRTTVRGYREDSVGPAPAGVPAGGEKMVNINAEIRATFVGNIGGHLFWDGGNVWNRGDRARVSNVRSSFGAGISYITPIGPISLEYGQKVNRRPGESPGEWYFAIGNSF